VRDVRADSDACARFDGSPAPHAHFHCRICRTVLDVPLPEALRSVSWPSGEIAAVEGFELHLTGACRRCAVAGS